MADGFNTTEQGMMNRIADETGDDALALGVDPEAERQPVYKVVGDTKRPVSKHAGSLWRSRKDAAVTKLNSTGKLPNWEEAIRYYKNDQRKNRTGSAIRQRAKRLSSEEQQDSENVVFANTSALVPAIYAKNPTCEITPFVRDDNTEENTEDDELKAIASASERLINALVSKKASPGINLKGKARKSVLTTTLTNISYIEIGYTLKDESSEEALIDLDRIGQELAEAKDQNEIQRLEGELEALEKKIDFLKPAGPWTKYRRPQDVLRDPDASESDLSDCQWVMVADYIATSFINAVYRERTGENEYKSIYKPTHVIGTTSGKEIDDQINSFSLVKDTTDYKSFGYSDDNSYQKALRTKVWYVWDKVTRRVYMFNDEDWSWPIWVWDDPYRLDTFYPIYPLEFYTDPEDDIGMSEVQYYLDQQDSINEINNEMKLLRQRAMGDLFYNKNVIKDKSFIDTVVQARRKRQKAIPVDVPPDADMSKAFFVGMPPSINYIQLFDKAQLYASIQKMSSVQPVMMGEQFKTNTTNDAVNTYNSTQQTRLDEKIDAVEDWLGNILWGVLQLCLQFMPTEQVATIIGGNDAQSWRNMTPEEIGTTFSVRVVGGSTQKPTSAVKKKEALEAGQMLGQFASAGQGVIVLQILKLMERAFDEFVMTADDWKFLQTAIMQSIQNSNPQGQPQGGGAVPVDVIQQIGGMIDQMDPQMKQALGRALGEALARGVPIAQAIPAIAQELIGPRG